MKQDGMNDDRNTDTRVGPRMKAWRHAPLVSATPVAPPLPRPPKSLAVYDFEGRATSIVGQGVSRSNGYNGLDTRIGSTTNTVARSFLRDGAYVTDPVLSDGAAIYTPGVSERLGSTTTYLHSGLKNADAQTSVSQALLATRKYDAFGNLASTLGSWQGPFGYAGAFGYAGGFGYQEDATGLKLLGHRLYDATTGRFLTRDPIRDGRNWYGYCDSDPLTGVDPTGLWNLHRLIYTGDANASDEVYEAALEQAGDTMQKAGTAYAGHLLRRGAVLFPPAVVTLGPIPKAVARPIVRPIGIRVPPGVGGSTSGVRLGAQWNPRLRPAARLVKTNHGALWLATFAFISWQATFDTWRDPSVWTPKAEK